MRGSPARAARPVRRRSRAAGTGLCLAAVTVVVASLSGAGAASGAVIAPNVNVSVGYADTVHGSFLPSPWNGDPGVIFAGDSGASSFDAGAVRVEVPVDGAPVTVDDVSVDVGSFHYAIWSGFLPVTIQPGEQLILTSTDGENFNTSDTSDGCSNNGVIPSVHLTIASSTFDYADSGQILNTGGRDLWSCLESNEGSDWTPVGGAGADVGVSLTANPASVSPGQNVDFTSTVTNDGPADATNVQLFEGLPGNVTFVSATPSQGSCELGEGGGVFCSLGSIANGASANVDVVATTPSDPESVSSTVDVSADEPDPNGGNNSSGATVNPCTTDCTGGWLDNGGKVTGPPIGGDVTQSATIIAPPGVHGPVSSTNTETSPCQEPPGFATYGKVFVVEVPAAPGGHVYLNRYRFVTSADPSVGVPPHEPRNQITLLRKCVEIPRCLFPRHRKLSSIPAGFQGCVYRVHRNRSTKVVTISELDTGNDPPIRGGG